MSEEKICGNCGKTDHNYVDCPYIDMQFPLTKKEYADLKEKARKWDELLLRNSHIDFGEWLQDTKLRELVEKKILEKNSELQKIIHIEHGLKSCGSDYHLQILNERDTYQQLIGASKK